MKIERMSLTIEELVKGYKDKGENGVVGYNGNLDIRPAYQREFVYGKKERNAVIHSVIKGYPLGSIFWVYNGNGKYELLDGQQRTISICQFVNNEFSLVLDGRTQYFRNIKETKLGEKILKTELDINVCKDGDKIERLEWFKTINIQGVVLNDQELLNATYTGSWLESAKKFFSKTKCPAYRLAEKYIKGSPIRQDYLETVLGWISDWKISDYMAKHYQDKDADDLIFHFNTVINWVMRTFPNYRKEMLGLDWGKLYKKYNGVVIDPFVLKQKIDDLMANEEVTNKKGIYEYVLSGDDENIARKLSKRNFSNSDKRTVYEKQKGICPICGEHHAYEDMEGDHIIPWWRGGKTTLDNLQMLCVKCNSGKGGKMKV